MKPTLMKPTFKYINRQNSGKEISHIFTERRAEKYIPACGGGISISVSKYNRATVGDHPEFGLCKKCQRSTVVLKAWMAYSRHDGPEGAILVLAHSRGEAKKAAYRYSWSEDYLDVGVRFLGPVIRHENGVWVEPVSDALPLANREKLARLQPHVIDRPESCEACEVWGQGVDSDGSCLGCGEYAGDRLTGLFGIDVDGLYYLPGGNSYA